MNENYMYSMWKLLSELRYERVLIRMKKERVHAIESEFRGLKQLISSLPLTKQSRDLYSSYIKWRRYFELGELFEWN